MSRRKQARPIRHLDNETSDEETAVKLESQKVARVKRVSANNARDNTQRIDSGGEDDLDKLSSGGEQHHDNQHGQENGAKHRTNKPANGKYIRSLFE